MFFNPMRPFLPQVFPGRTTIMYTGSIAHAAQDVLLTPYADINDGCLDLLYAEETSSTLKWVGKGKERDFWQLTSLSSFPPPLFPS